MAGPVFEIMGYPSRAGKIWPHQFYGFLAVFAKISAQIGPNWTILGIFSAS
jgi:hypothetical protein